MTARMSMVWLSTATSIAEPGGAEPAGSLAFPSQARIASVSTSGCTGQAGVVGQEGDLGAECASPAAWEKPAPVFGVCWMNFLAGPAIVKEVNNDLRTGGL